MNQDYNSFFKELIKKSPDTIVILNEKVRFINPKGEELLEYLLEDLSSGSFGRFIHNDD